jgi:transcriptional regulator with XRE-family HTH domain
MNKLKELRTRYGLKQRDVAKRLRTTQQTVARWESGQSSIPVAQLKDLAIMFGCSVDELLGVELHPRQRDAAGFARDKQGVPFGTFKITFAHGELEYPVDEREVEKLHRHFHPTVDLAVPAGWLEVGALNNRLIFLNPSHVAELELISDDTEAMPFFTSPEVYQSLTKDIPVTQLGHLAAAERAEVIRRITGNATDGEFAPEDEDKIIQDMNCVRVIYADGRASTHYLDDDTASELLILSSNLDGIAGNAFLRIYEEGPDRRIINLSKVAVIEVPLEAYLQCLENNS